MALEAKRAAFNTAMIAAEAAWDDLIDGLSQGDEVLLLFPKEWTGTASTSLNTLYGTTASMHERTVYKVHKAGDGGIRWFLPGLDIGGVPIGMRCTNTAGELS